MRISLRHTAFAMLQWIKRILEGRPGDGAGERGERQAEAWLHRAIAQGAGAPAWEALGDAAAAAGDEARARLAYGNALRGQRGEAPLPLPGRDLRQDIADAAAVEDRDDHGLPRLRG